MKTTIKREDMPDEWLPLLGTQYEVNPERMSVRHSRTRRPRKRSDCYTLRGESEMQFSCSIQKLIYCAINRVPPMTMTKRVYACRDGSVSIEQPPRWWSRLTVRTYSPDYAQSRYKDIRNDLPLIASAMNGDTAPLVARIFNDYAEITFRYIERKFGIKDKEEKEDFFADIAIETVERIKRGVIVSDVALELRRVASQMIHAAKARAKREKSIEEINVPKLNDLYN